MAATVLVLVLSQMLHLHERAYGKPLATDVEDISLISLYPWRFRGGSRLQSTVRTGLQRGIQMTHCLTRS
jgi:hypothetical protein